MSKRFRVNNARALVAHLHETGIDPEAEMVAPNPRYHNGCLDPNHCPQHPNLGPLRTVQTHVSGRALHRLAKKLRLI